MTKPEEVILYSGGHKGTEAEFGKNAEISGIREVTFTFEGHDLSRDASLTHLDDEALRAGDISMEIVSKHMGRRYASAEKIRKVIQSIYHMVNSSEQVFAVGWIQEDETVKGGTGWGVELAKMFHKPVSVFDQDKNLWYSWSDSHWKEDVPVINTKSFCGTGTRNLTPQGIDAIKELFERSFK